MVPQIAAKCTAKPAGQAARDGEGSRRRETFEPARGAFVTAVCCGRPKSDGIINFPADGCESRLIDFLRPFAVARALSS